MKQHENECTFTKYDWQGQQNKIGFQNKEKPLEFL